MLSYKVEKRKLCSDNQDKHINPHQQYKELAFFLSDNHTEFLRVFLLYLFPNLEIVQIMVQPTCQEQTKKIVEINSQKANNPIPNHTKI
jgi:hypothetical protein